MAEMCDMMVCNSPNEWTEKVMVQFTMQSTVFVVSELMERFSSLVMLSIMSLNKW